MANRTTTLSDIWARLAQLTIPDNPVNGTGYRNTNISAAIINQGWLYNTAVPSEYTNEYLYRISFLLDQIEKQGILSWCSTTAYPAAGVFCLGSNNQLYISLQASTNKNPTTETSYWQLFTAYVKPALGSWASKSNDTVYLAATDGFVSAYTDDGTIQGFTDSSNPPTTLRDSNHEVNDNEAGITLIVKKGDYWKVTGATNVFWIPFGT